MKIGTVHIDIQAILAVGWFLSSLAITILLLDKLGGRGWIWLCLNHLLCIIGCSHEYRRYRQREQVRRSQT